MEYKLLLVFFLQHLITSLPVDEDDLFYDDDDDDDTSPVDFSTLDTSPQLYQVELEDIKLLNQLVEIITPEFFELKENGTICGLSYFIPAQKIWKVLSVAETSFQIYYAVKFCVNVSK